MQSAEKFDASAEVAQKAETRKKAAVSECRKITEIPGENGSVPVKHIAFYEKPAGELKPGMEKKHGLPAEASFKFFVQNFYAKIVAKEFFDGVFRIYFFKDQVVANIPKIVETLVSAEESEFVEEMEPGAGEQSLESQPGSVATGLPEVSLYMLFILLYFYYFCVFLNETRYRIGFRSCSEVCEFFVFCLFRLCFFKRLNFDGWLEYIYRVSEDFNDRLFFPVCLWFERYSSFFVPG